MLGFKGILYVHFSFEDHGSGFSFFSHAFSGGTENIKRNNITCSEFPVFNSLFWSFFIDNNLVSINQMFLGFMGENTLNCAGSFKFLKGLGNIGGNILIGRSNLDSSSGSDESVVGSENDISLFTVRFSTNNNSVSGN